MSGRTLKVKTPVVFAPLWEPARYKGGYGGRGSGKSHNFSEMGVVRCQSSPGTRMVCVREVQKSLKESVKLLLEDKIQGFELGQEFDVQHDRIITPGDGLILFQGMQDHTAESIKSLEGFDIAYIEEAQTLSHRSLELLRPTIRKPGSEIWASWNPRSAEDPIDKFLRGLNPPADSAIVQANWRDNPFFPDVLEAERKHDQVANPERYGHIWEGDYEPAAIGAIWSRANFHAYRKAKAPPLTRIVVAIDPQGKKALEPGETDDTGIIAAGLGQDGRGYVLADATLNDTPRNWARRAISVYDGLDADAIVVETNNGGDMVRHTIESVRPGINVIEVTATRGKHVRAEPISALYEQGLVSHVGTYSELEGEMCLTTAWGYDGPNSPNRMDALVWAMTELMPQLTVRVPMEEEEDYYMGDQGRSEVTGY